LGPYFRPRLEDFLEEDELFDRLDFFAALPDDFVRDVPRWERPELLLEEEAEPRPLEPLLRLLLRDPEDELDLLREELFFRAVAIRSNLLSIQTHRHWRKVVPPALERDRDRSMVGGALMNYLRR
jgi:hypothetical protein